MVRFEYCDFHDGSAESLIDIACTSKLWDHNGLLDLLVVHLTQFSLVTQVGAIKMLGDLECIRVNRWISLSIQQWPPQ